MKKITAKDGCINFMFLGHPPYRWIRSYGSNPEIRINKVLKTRDGNLEVYSVISANVSPFIRRSNPWDERRDLMQPNLKPEKISRSFPGESLISIQVMEA